VTVDGKRYWDRNAPGHADAVEKVAAEIADYTHEVPATLPRYKGVQVPPGVHEDDAGALLDAAAKLGASEERAQELLDYAAGIAPAPAVSPIEMSPEEAEGELRRRWGSDYGRRMDLARAAVFARPGVGSWLVDTGLGNHPEVIAAFVKMGARARLQELRADPAYMNASHARHADLVREVSRLYAVTEA
jgi:hypothetical protein